MKHCVFILLAGLIPVTLFSQATHQHETKSTATKAIAVLHPTKGSTVRGVVTFEVVKGGVRVVASISGLTPGKHGFHIHEFGDCSSDDGMAAGAHFDPTTKPHGAPTSDERHVGDLGNVEADKDGNARVDYVDAVLKLEGPTSILGRAVIVHEKEDDLKTQPTGNAGGRLACGVIGVAKQQ